MRIVAIDSLRALAKRVRGPMQQSFGYYSRQAVITNRLLRILAMNCVHTLHT